MNILDFYKMNNFLNKHFGFTLPASIMVVAKCLKLIWNQSGIISRTYFSPFQGVITDWSLCDNSCRLCSIKNLPMNWLSTLFFSCKLMYVSWNIALKFNATYFMLQSHFSLRLQKHVSKYFCRFITKNTINQ